MCVVCVCVCMCVCVRAWADLAIFRSFDLFCSYFAEGMFGGGMQAGNVSTKLDIPQVFKAVFFLEVPKPFVTCVYLFCAHCLQN